jgi:hypothetical protein
MMSLMKLREGFDEIAMEGPKELQPLTPTLSPEYRGEGVCLF